MKKLILLPLLIAFLMAKGKLINVNFFEMQNRVDVLLSLDEKYKGKVIKLGNDEYYLTDIIALKGKKKVFDKGFLKEIDVNPYKFGVKLKIVPKEKIKVSFALTPDGYGIRVRIESLAVKKQNEYQKLLASNPEKGIDYTSYIVGLAILTILAIILFLMRKRVKNLPVANVNMGVVIQKPIDPKNKVVLFEFNKRKYLMVVGNTNLLLDVFDEDLANVTTQKEFDEFLKSEKLDEIKRYIKNAEELKELDEKI